MEMSFSRGFSHGFLDGNDHKVLVRGDYAKKRGVFLGRVAPRSAARVRLDLAAPVKPGDGLVFDGDEAAGIPEQGGRVYEVVPPGRGARRRAGRRPLRRPRRAWPSAGSDLDLRRLRAGQRALEDRRPRADPPPPQRRSRAPRTGTVDLDLTVRAVAGEPLALEGRTAAGFARPRRRRRPARRRRTAPRDGRRLCATSSTGSAGRSTAPRL